MPNIKQQKRRVDIAARQRFENLRYRSSAKTLYKRLETAVESGDQSSVAAAHQDLIRCLDKAAATRAIHPNKAARKKAQAARLVGS
jgi:small subunit ribosomal protein S20